MEGTKNLLFEADHQNTEDRVPAAGPGVREGLEVGQGHLEVEGHGAGHVADPSKLRKSILKSTFFVTCQ